MAKSAQRQQDEGGNGSSGRGETTSGYFRRLFKENPKLLKASKNDAILERWLQDHPGETEVPKNVKNNLANIKSVLRNRRRKRKGSRRAAGAEEAGSAPVKLGRPAN